MRHTVKLVVLGVLCLAAMGSGYGGFEAAAGFVNFGDVNDILTVFNRDSLKGDGRLAYKGPLWWFGGHGGDQVGVVTLGGSGAFTARATQADSLSSELAAIRANFEVGFPHSPVEWFTVRPCVELAGAGMVIYAHTKENGEFVGNFSARFKRWYAAWIVGAAPGVELMGSLPTSEESFLGLFVKTSYFFPVSGPRWFGDKDPPGFGLSGFSVQVGLRFGKTAPREFEM